MPSGNITKERVHGVSSKVARDLELLSNVAYIIALSDKGSNPLKDKDYMHEINSKVGAYLSPMGSQPNEEINRFLLKFTQNCIITEPEPISLNPEIRSVSEMHAILNSLIPSKEMLAGPGAWADRQTKLMSDIIDASKGLDGDAREHFFASLRLSDDPKKFVELVGALDKGSEAFTSKLWQAALNGDTKEDKVFSKEVLVALKDIHNLDKFHKELKEGIAKYVLIEHSTPKSDLYDIISKIPEAEKDPKSYINEKFKEKNYDIFFGSDFTINKGLLELKASLLQNAAFASIENDLKIARKNEDIVKAIYKYEQEYAQKGGRKLYQEMQKNIQEVNNLLATITVGKDAKPLKIEDLQRIFESGAPFDATEAIKYKLTGKSSLLDHTRSITIQTKHVF